MHLLAGDIGDTKVDLTVYPNIYAYLKDTGYIEEPDWLAARLAEAEDATRVISETALSSEQTCELCQATLDLFVEILGAEAGNFTLKLMATGPGNYIFEGVPAQRPVY